MWLSLFGGLLIDKSGRAATSPWSATTSAPPTPTRLGTAHDLVASGADVLALEEITPTAKPVYEKELAEAYPHHTVQGTVGLWSKLPLTDTRPVDIGMDAGPLADSIPATDKLAYNRALRTTVATDQGPLAVYVAHLGSVRIFPRERLLDGQPGPRRTGARQGRRRRRERAAGAARRPERDHGRPRVRRPHSRDCDSAQEAAGNGFGFTFPARFPVARDRPDPGPRRAEPRSSWVLPATGGDHRCRWRPESPPVDAPTSDAPESEPWRRRPEPPAPADRRGRGGFGYFIGRQGGV